MAYKNILCERKGQVGIITVNRSEQRNALDRPTCEEFHAALDELNADRNIRVVIITGSGDKVFVAGADLREMQKKNKLDALEAMVSPLCFHVERIDKPVIAAVNGYALGGGCELALACDIRVASEKAVFGFPETGLGIIPAAGGTQRLPRVIGLGRAKEMILTGEWIDAKRAEQIGLIRCTSPHEKLMDCAMEVAQKILTRAPLATRMAKLAMNMAMQMPLDAGLNLETVTQSMLYESRDKLEGTTAFLEKRKPNFTGE